LDIRSVTSCSPKPQNPSMQNKKYFYIIKLFFDK